MGAEGKDLFLPGQDNQPPTLIPVFPPMVVFWYMQIPSIMVCSGVPF